MSSDLGEATSYPHIYHGLPQSIHVNSWTVHWIGRDRFLSDTYYFVIHKSSIHSTPNNLNFVRFDVITAVVTESTIFWDTTPCSPLKVIRRFGGTYRLHLQGRISRARNQRESRALLGTCFHAGFLLGVYFNPEDGGKMFLRNVGWHSTDYTALYPRR
jgi:hypothetical protein